VGPSQNRPVKIPYTTVRNGHRFFEPRGRMREHGFRSVPLGLDSEATRRAAWALYERWLAIRDGHEALPDTSKPHSKIEIASRKIYPPGSIGHAWQKWIRTDEWKRLAPANRNKIWWEAWIKRIEPVFGDCAPDTVTMEALSAWRQAIEDTSGTPRIRRSRSGAPSGQLCRPSAIRSSRTLRGRFGIASPHPGPLAFHMARRCGSPRRHGAAAIVVLHASSDRVGHGLFAARRAYALLSLSISGRYQKNATSG